ncbi:hypothetical protein L579_0557 [Pantoea sp. AS-PWVM4]|nr:hypothetical protein L579_0557 [Pantoea sp. AS-PWVM4]
MTTATKSAVNVYAVFPDIESVYRLIQQHCGVFEIFLHSYSDKSCNRSDKGS